MTILPPLPPTHSRALPQLSRAFALYGKAAMVHPWAGLEGQLLKLVRQLLGVQAESIAAQIAAQVAASQTPSEAAVDWAALNQQAMDTLTPMVEKIAVAGVSHALQSNQVGSDPNIRIAWDLFNARARDWAKQYAAELVKQVSATTKDKIRERIAGWIESGAPMADLIDEISNIQQPGAGQTLFGRSRAENIAVTEATRVFAASNEAAWANLGYQSTAIRPPGHPRCRCTLHPVTLPDGSKVMIWRTAVDELVCKKQIQTPWGVVGGCVALHNVIVSNGPYMGQNLSDVSGGPAPAGPKPAPGAAGITAGPGLAGSFGIAAPQTKPAPKLSPAQMQALIKQNGGWMPKNAATAQDLITSLGFPAEMAGDLQQWAAKPLHTLSGAQQKVMGELSMALAYAQGGAAYNLDQTVIQTALAEMPKPVAAPELAPVEPDPYAELADDLYNPPKEKPKAPKKPAAPKLTKEQALDLLKQNNFDWTSLSKPKLKQVVAALGYPKGLVSWFETPMPELTSEQQAMIGKFEQDLLDMKPKPQPVPKVTPPKPKKPKPVAPKPAPPVDDKKKKLVDYLHSTGLFDLGDYGTWIHKQDNDTLSNVLALMQDAGIEGGENVPEFLSKVLPGEMPKKEPIEAPAVPTPAPESPKPPAGPILYSQIKPLEIQELKKLDLHKTLPGWEKPEYQKGRYGGVIFNDQGQVLLREPTNHHDKYWWTFPKGSPDPGDHPVDTALREIGEETGHSVEILGALHKGFSSGNSTTYFFVTRSTGENPKLKDKETEQTKWVDYEEAKKLINLTQNPGGKKRDLEVLDAAFAEYKAMTVEGKTFNDAIEEAKKKKAAEEEAERKRLEAEQAARLARQLAKQKPMPPPKSAWGEPPKAFPASPDALEIMRGLGGHSGANATLAKDNSGKMFVVKRLGDSSDGAARLSEEAYADSAYRAAGLNVPQVHIYQTPGGVVKVSEYVEGQTLSALKSGDPAKYKKAVKQVQKGLAADALMGNWDVIGTGYDNILVDKAGKVWRIDNGGSMRYRATGSAKTPEQWNANPTELWSLRDAQYPYNHEVFGDVKWREIVGQMEDLGKKRSEILAELPADVQPVVSARLATMEHLVEASKGMEKDQWAEPYQDKFSQQIVELRKAGVVEAMPDELKVKKSGKYHDPHTVVDQSGKPFDNMRGNGSVVTELAKYINANGGNYNVISDYLSGQAGSSWSTQSQAFKYLIASRARDKGKETWYWRDGYDHAKKCFDGVAKQYGADTVIKSFQMYHAFTYEFLSRAEMPNKNPDGTFTVIRTESADVLRNQGIQKGDKGKPLQRGALESFSGFHPAYIYGSEITLQRVMPYQVFATFFFERYPGRGGGALLGDGENEFVCIPDDGLLVDYTG